MRRKAAVKAEGTSQADFDRSQEAAESSQNAVDTEDSDARVEVENALETESSGSTPAQAEDDSLADLPFEPADPTSSDEVTTESIIEAVLLSTEEPLPPAKIAQVLGVGDAGDVKEAIESLNKRYAANGASYRIEFVAKGYQILTLPVYDRWIHRLHGVRKESRLSAAALETLAVVAYKQPVLRAEIEAIRGVACGDSLNRLREMDLVKIVGRAEELGRPMLYGTTKRFLEVFGLGTLDQLPEIEEILPKPAEKPVAIEASNPSPATAESL